jgi:hypothetical protein
MSQYVFILGAGASKHAGAPLMADFLDKSRALFAANRVNECSDDLQRVFDAISELQSVHSKSELDIVNLESVFSAFEMAELLDVPPAGRNLVHSMKRLIAWTLDEAVLFELGAHKVFSTPAYRDFASLISRLANEFGPSPRSTVITFNYDVAVDVALRSAGLSLDYGLNGDAGGSRRAVNIFKLHGSVGWHRCSVDSCRKIVAEETFPPLVASPGTTRLKWSQLRPLLGGQAKCCGQAVDEGSVIVPPSWNKAEYRSDLDKVWRRAAAELKSATTIVVCGYSLPETDSFFRYLYGLGTAGGEPLERFWVLDPSMETHERFRGMLGPGARARFQARTCTFDQAVQYLGSALT